MTRKETDEESIVKLILKEFQHGVGPVRAYILMVEPSQVPQW